LRDGRQEALSLLSHCLPAVRQASHLLAGSSEAISPTVFYSPTLIKGEIEGDFFVIASKHLAETIEAICFLLIFSPLWGESRVRGSVFILNQSYTELKTIIW